MGYCKRHKWLVFLCSGRNSGKFGDAASIRSLMVQQLSVIKRRVHFMHDSSWNNLLISHFLTPIKMINEILICCLPLCTGVCLCVSVCVSVCVFRTRDSKTSWRRCSFSREELEVNTQQLLMMSMTSQTELGSRSLRQVAPPPAAPPAPLSLPSSSSSSSSS